MIKDTPNNCNEKIRLPFIDVAKALAIIFMIHVHVFEEYGQMIFDNAAVVEKAHPWFYKFIFNITGGVFTAPLCMFCMGIGMTFSRKNTPLDFFARGVNLTKKAWLLNIFRDAVPYTIFCPITLKTPGRLLFYLFNLDILHFAGLAFFVMSIFNILKFSDKAVFIVSVLFSIIASLLQTLHFDSYALSVIAGHFTGTDHENFLAAFPLFSWLIFAAGGRLFGSWLKKGGDSAKFFRYTLPVSAIIFFSWISYTWTHNTGFFRGDELSYYHMNLLCALFSFAGIFFILGISQSLAVILPEKLLSLCEFMGKNLNEIYILQWLIIGWLLALIVPAFLGKTDNVFLLSLLAVLIILLSCLLAEPYKKLFDKKR
ncbi:MAG: DUF1624 domain-containing protein [Synergistaceae bacterium]|nr:DUF1624 domain-containing protein [Candidatus Equadaptatus faecalis]